MTRTIALIDFSISGHHEAYIKIFIRSFLSLGYKVYTIVPQSDTFETWANENLSDKKDNLLFSDYDIVDKEYNLGRFSDAAKQLSALKQINSLLKHNPFKEEVSHTFFLYADRYLANNMPGFLVNYVFPRPWSGIYFHPRHMRLNNLAIKKKGSWRDIDSLFLSKYCKGIAVHDEGIVNTFTKRLSNQVVLFPEIADETPPSQNNTEVIEFTNLAKERKKVGMFGTLSPHQGFMDFIKLIGSVDLTKYYFVIAGPLMIDSFSEKDQKIITSFLDNPPENCYIKIKYLQEGEEFNSYVNGIDLLYLVYNNFPSASNRLTKAAIFNKPVISSERFCVGEDVIKYNLGETAKEHDLESIINALNTCSNKTYPEKNFIKYRNLHSVNTLDQQITKILT